MNKLTFIIELIQEFDENTHKLPKLSWEERQLQEKFKFISNRIVYDHRLWLKRLIEEQGSVCKVCGISPVVGHHIMPVELFPELVEDISNGIILCLVCHSKVHKMLQYLGFVSRTDFEQMLKPKNIKIEGYTVEELAKLSGYSIKTIYNLTAYKVLRPPIRGVDQSKYRSKGLYSPDTLTKLQRFTELKNSGRHSKDRIILIMQNDLLQEDEEATVCQ